MLYYSLCSITACVLVLLVLCYCLCSVTAYALLLLMLCYCLCSVTPSLESRLGCHQVPVEELQVPVLPRVNDGSCTVLYLGPYSLKENPVSITHSLHTALLYFFLHLYASAIRRTLADIL